MLVFGEWLGAGLGADYCGRETGAGFAIGLGTIVRLASSELVENDGAVREPGAGGRLQGNSYWQ